MFQSSWSGYWIAAWMLMVGAVLGGALMAGLPGVWQTRMATAHIYVNVGGFVGCAALASLTVLVPAMWRGRGVRDRTSVSLVALLAGIAVAVCGASAGWPPAEGIGLVIYAAGWVWSLQGWVATLIGLIGSRLRPTYPALSALAAVIWPVVSILIHAVRLLRGAESQPPILMLLLGFVAQLLIGTLSYLLPTTMRGGPGAVRAGVRRLDAGGVFRFALYNLALVTWLLAQNSALRMAMSLLVFGVLLAFLPLLGSGVKSRLAVLKGKAEPPVREYDAHSVV